MSAAIALVLHDLQATGAPMPTVEESDWQEYPGAESAYLWDADGSGMGVWVDTAASEAQQVAMLADQVQEWVVERMAQNRATNWPPCPDHPHNHPLAAVAKKHHAMWQCPTSGRKVSQIGRLGQPE